MKTKYSSGWLGLLMFALFAAGSGAWAKPVVDNIRVRQIEGTMEVEVLYDLTGGVAPITVTIVFSEDNGATWGIVPESITGDVGLGDMGVGVENGDDREVIWDAAKDRPGILWENAGVTVTATDASGADNEEITVTLPGDVPLVLVKIPADTFVMGSPDLERSRETDEGPAHEVKLWDDFYMGKFEVTQEQWLAVMGEWPNNEPNKGVGPNYPAYYISWDDISVGDESFIHKLNHLTSITLSDGAFRLPSEAEWEYACRAGTTTRFYFGDALTPEDDRLIDGPAGTLPGNRSDYMWFGGDESGVGTKEVGQNRPNHFGLYDMSGNVAEWCLNNYDAYPGGVARIPPFADTDYVVRGGFWESKAESCRSASRYAWHSWNRYHDIGFRVSWHEEILTLSETKGSMKTE